MDHGGETQWNSRPFNILPPEPPSPFRIAEIYMFDACTHKCGYCWLAESGQVLDFRQLERFRNLEFIHQIAAFFNSRTHPPEQHWLLTLTGGEPLIAPNLERLCRELFACGNRVSFYTALLVDRNHPGFRFLTESSFPDVDYIMASFHPEAEFDEPEYFEKIRLLKQAGHKVFVRFVGHPARLHRLDELAAKCAALGVCFYPTSLLSDRYPAAYPGEQRGMLRRHTASLSQRIMLEGGIDTSSVRCHAGSRVVAVNLQTGNITACITVHHPSMGNLFEDRLELHRQPIACPEAGVNCLCDVHFQQNIVIGSSDRHNFERLKQGYAPPHDFTPEIDAMKEAGVRFYGNPRAGIGGVADDTRLFYTLDEVRRHYRRARGLA